MSDHRDELNGMLTDPDPVRRAQIQMQKPAVRRFYKDVTTGKAEGGGHAVLLDGRSLKTPAKNTLSVPTAALAGLLRDEWDAQGETIEPDAMPITRLVNTAIDGVSVEHRAVFAEILRFAGTDMLCYRADQPEGLVARQNAVWDPILDWMAGAGGAPFLTVSGIMHREQPAAAINGYAELLRNYATPLGLTCLHTITSLTGSAILAIAFAEGFRTPDDIWAAAHVDEDWQISQWGEDEEAALRRARRYIDFDAAVRTLDSLR
ncbi:Chaperone required for the assembly of the F1-ATPase [Rhizobium sp. RU20A]|uniref:ATP12 family chaperone protein n=1 Tax=Rhizobium sp. RU20A TaxID=1907412 RepID=UPI0009574261|nr:ATP12 family chaperone protein [Rhizobium sp. RU20A]SIQ04184.1 Chaperone required for the assembly of the F1-ATPase [Rhizobium sp. RU20A]